MLTLTQKIEHSFVPHKFNKKKNIKYTLIESEGEHQEVLKGTVHISTDHLTALSQLHAH